jgi:hypothetical protein
MQILSALDAVSPAFSRTKLVLFSPFRVGRTWKLAATGYLATISNVFLPMGLVALFFIPMARQAGGSTAVTILISIAIGITLISLTFIYLFSRLGFAFFDITLNRGQFVAPAWRKYGQQSFKWTIFKVILGTLVTAAFAVPTAAYIRHMIWLFSTLQMKPGEQPTPQFISAVFAGYAAFFLIYLGFGLFYFISSLFGDFVIPSLALEDTTLGEAFLRLGRLIKKEPGQFTLYAVLKLGIAFVGYMAASIGYYVVLLAVALVLGGVAVLIGLLLHLIGVSTAILTALGIALGSICYMALFFYAVILGSGTVLTFLESYMLYFLGGRYPMLGELLERSTPLPPVYTPPTGYPPYYPPYVR